MSSQCLSIKGQQREVFRNKMNATALWKEGGGAQMAAPRTEGAFTLPDLKRCCPAVMCMTQVAHGAAAAGHRKEPRAPFNSILIFQLKKLRPGRGIGLLQATQQTRAPTGTHSVISRRTYLHGCYKPDTWIFKVQMHLPGYCPPERDSHESMRFLGHLSIVFPSQQPPSRLPPLTADLRCIAAPGNRKWNAEERSWAALLPPDPFVLVCLGLCHF